MQKKESDQKNRIKYFFSFFWNQDLHILIFFSGQFVAKHIFNNTNIILKSHLRLAKVKGERMKDAIKRQRWIFHVIDIFEWVRKTLKIQCNRIANENWSTICNKFFSSGFSNGKNQNQKRPQQKWKCYDLIKCHSPPPQPIVLATSFVMLWKVNFS